MQAKNWPEVDEYLRQHPGSDFLSILQGVGARRDVLHTYLNNGRRRGHIQAEGTARKYHYFLAPPKLPSQRRKINAPNSVFELALYL